MSSRQPVGLVMNMGLPPLDLPYFLDNGFSRLQCRVTGTSFWCRDGSRTTCGDTTEDEYTFIGTPLIGGFSETGKALKDSMRNTFLNYFAERNHSIVPPRPVLARWRDDIHLTIASIAAFQPHATSGLVEPPANPLTISQPCIRLTDVDAVGRSGRHLTTFEMMAHHVFNRPNDGQMYYWMNECVEYCDDLFVNHLGIPAAEITYVENPWSGGGNAGPALEVIVGGLELATLVFMNLEEHPEGDVDIKGVKYREMDLQIIDTGYGLERFCWAAAGTPTIYEAIYPDTVNWLKQLVGFDEVIADLPDLDLNKLLGEISMLSGIMNIEIGSDEGELIQTFLRRLSERGIEISSEVFSKVTTPLQAIYAIPDHMHALCNMLGDGLVPSNSKAGYLARMLARRVLRLRDDLGLSISLAELGSHHIEVNLGNAQMKQTKDGLLTILALEEERYGETLRKGENVVKGMLKKVSHDSTELPDELLFTLSETHGLAPDIVVRIARQNGFSNVKLRTGFAAEMAARHASLAKAAAGGKKKSGILPEGLSLPETTLQYYEDVNQVEFESTVLWACEIAAVTTEGSASKGAASHAIVLGQSCFYPEGGGQVCDLGSLCSGDRRVDVIDVQKEGNYVIHFTNGPLFVGDMVSGIVDSARRRQLMDHHTAVHIVGGAARLLLGPHVYQAGANKNVEGARLDITHYRRLTDQDLEAIEVLSNNVLNQVQRTEKMELNRKEADAKFGFDLYQGGAPKGAEVKIIRIGEHDIQACGGTHHDEPSKIGSIRIVKSTAVQDGVERLHIVAGQAALTFARNQDKLLRQASEIFGVAEHDLPRTSQRFFDEWKAQRRKIEALEAEIVRVKTSGDGDASTEKDGVRIVIMEGHGELRQLQGMIGELTRDVNLPTVAVVGSKEGGGKIIVAITENTIASERYNAVDILRSISSHIRGGGGGRPTIAQGGGTYPEGLDDALNAARQLLLG